jgi:hypothetical protein
MIYAYGEPRWNDTDRGKPKNSGENPAPVPLCPPQTPHGMNDPGANKGISVESPATNHLSYGTAMIFLILLYAPSVLNISEFPIVTLATDSYFLKV